MSIALKKIYIQYILLPSFFSLDVHRNLHKESWRKKERNKTNILYTRVRISVLRKVVEGLTKQKKNTDGMTLCGCFWDEAEIQRKITDGDKRTSRSQ